MIGSAITDRGFTDHEHLDESQSGVDPSGYFGDSSGDVQTALTVTGNEMDIHLTGGNGAQRQAAKNAIVGALEKSGFRLTVDQIGSQHTSLSAQVDSQICADPASYEYQPPSAIGPWDPNLFAEIATSGIPFLSRAVSLIDASLAHIHGLKHGLETGDFTPVGPLTHMFPTEEELQTSGIGSLLATGPAGVGRSVFTKSAVSLVDDASRRIGAVATPFGEATQATSAAAVAARTQVADGAKLWRMGTTGRSAAVEAQFWALDNPLSPGFASRTVFLPPTSESSTLLNRQCYVREPRS